MKRLISLLCLLAMILPLAACSSSLATEETKTAAEETETEIKAEEEKGEIVYPDSFAVGYARVDITGAVPVPIFEDEGTVVQDPLMLTCTAVWDGETAALLMSADIRGMQNSVAQRNREMIEKQFGVPAANIIINCTHTHSAPAAGSSSDAGIRWNANYYKQLPIVVEAALRDLDEVENVYAGKSFTERLTFVRRYLLPDGTYKTNPGNVKVVAHESQADPELQTLRFDRKTKKDVLMINYQTHHCSGIGAKKISADFVAPYREKAEKELDVHFVYHQGAGGNVNFLSSIPDERLYPDYISSADGFMITTRDALSKEEKVNVGKLRTISRDLTVTVQKDPEDRVEAARKVMEAPENQRGSLAAQYGFETWRAANSTVSRANKGETEQMPLTAITFGDIAFASAPIEMFDTNGMEIKQGSPYKMTFVLTLGNQQSWGYFPTKLSFEHGGYAADTCRFMPGIGEDISSAFVKLLGEL